MIEFLFLTKLNSHSLYYIHTACSILILLSTKAHIKYINNKIIRK